MATTPKLADNGCHSVKVKQEKACIFCPCGVMKAKQEQLAQTVAKK